MERFEEEYEDELEVKDEWLITEPTPTTKTTLFVCPKCQAVHPLRNHMPKGKFDPECPKCRRKRTMRNLQRRRYAEKKAEVEKTKAGIAKLRSKAWSRTVGRLDYKIRKIQKMLDHYVLARQEKGVLGIRQSQREYRYKVLMEFYQSVRPAMVVDWERWEEKPFLYYMEKEPIL